MFCSPEKEALLKEALLKYVNFLTQEHINQCIEEQVMRVVQRVKIEKKHFRMQLLKSKPHH